LIAGFAVGGSKQRQQMRRAEDDGNTSTLYRVTAGWVKFGMGTPYNPSRVEFDPPGMPPKDFLGAHMLISTDKGTTAGQAHTSIIRNEYMECEDSKECVKGNKIGYEPAWRCVLGTGDASVSSKPVADAGPNGLSSARVTVALTSNWTAQAQRTMIAML
jgi:hypothetical protein